MYLSAKLNERKEMVEMMKVEATKSNKEKIFKKAVVAGLLGNAVSIALLYGCAVMLWYGKLPETLLAEYVLGATFGGAIVSGKSFSKGDKSAVMGAVGGLIYFLILTLIAIYRTQGDTFDTEYLKLFICSIAGGAFGGLLLIGKRTKKQRVYK